LIAIRVTSLTRLLLARVSSSTNTLPPGKRGPARCGQPSTAVDLATTILGTGHSSVISRLVSVPESVSVARKCVSFSIFHQSIEDSDKPGIMIAWLGEEFGQLCLKDGVNFAGTQGRVSAIQDNTTCVRYSASTLGGSLILWPALQLAAR